MEPEGSLPRSYGPSTGPYLSQMPILVRFDRLSQESYQAPRSSVTFCNKLIFLR
jgi:hypothetical protein